MMSRCKSCKNCKMLERVRASVLRVLFSPFQRGDDEVVTLWNRELKRLKCTGEQHEITSS